VRGAGHHASCDAGESRPDGTSWARPDEPQESSSSFSMKRLGVGTHIAGELEPVGHALQDALTRDSSVYSPTWPAFWGGVLPRSLLVSSLVLDLGRARAVRRTKNRQFFTTFHLRGRCRRQAWEACVRLGYVGALAPLESRLEIDFTFRDAYPRNYATCQCVCVWRFLCVCVCLCISSVSVRV
jgi:hypothetical protein